MTRKYGTKPALHRLDNGQLLDLRFRDLPLRLDESPVSERVEQLYAELQYRGIRFRPHCWLGEEWFSPDGVPGIGIPFYLSHPRLAKLEYEQMFEVEGGTPQECMKLLRHEAGHAIMTAYQLARRPRCRKMFGKFSRPYPADYTPNPASDRHVLHLDWWYAQAHPAEDFAETFAVWLKPRSGWRKKYAGWRAIRKLEYMDELMKSIADKPLINGSRRKVESISSLDRTLRQHYQRKKEHYCVEAPEFYDSDLLRIFSTTPSGKKRKTAARFLQQIGPKLCRASARGMGEYPYAVSQMLKEMIHRCRELKLYVDDSDETLYMEVAVFLSMQVLHYLRRIRHRIPI